MYESALDVCSLRMRLAVGFVIVAHGCAPQKSADPAAVVSAPRVVPRAETDAPVDAGIAESAPEAVSDAEPPAASRPDAEATQAALSPPLSVAFAAVFRDPTSAVFGTRIYLFDKRVTCADAERPDHPGRVFDLNVRWASAYSNVSTVLTVKGGQTTHYHARVEVISAPARVGALGKIRLAEGDEYNVGAGDVDVLVCK